MVRPGFVNLDAEVNHPLLGVGKRAGPDLWAESSGCRKWPALARHHTAAGQACAPRLSAEQNWKTPAAV